MNDLYAKLAQAVVKMDAAEVVRLSGIVLEKGYPPEEAIEKGLAAGMNEVGRLFAAKKYFVPEVLVCSKAMYAGFDILKDKVVEGGVSRKGTVVIGVVEGDFHDIGKNIVKLLLESSGFDLVDLGKNVSQDKFLGALAEQKPALLALSTLMTTTMDRMAQIADSVLHRFPKVKLMIGGAPVNGDFARSIGAHFYGKDARAAVLGAHDLMGIPI